MKLLVHGENKNGKSAWNGENRKTIPYNPLLRPKIALTPNNPTKIWESSVVLAAYQATPEVGYPIIAPRPERIDHVRFYRFYFRESVVLVKCDNRPTPEPLDSLAINPGNPVTILKTRGWSCNMATWSDHDKREGMKELNGIHAFRRWYGSFFGAENQSIIHWGRISKLWLTSGAKRIPYSQFLPPKSPPNAE